MLDLMRSDSQLALKHKPFRIHSESRDSDIFMSQGTDLAGTDGPAHSSASSMNGSVQQQMANLHAKMMKRRSHKKRGFIRTMVDRAKRVFSKDTYFEVFDNLSEAAITQFVPFEKVGQASTACIQPLLCVWLDVVSSGFFLLYAIHVLIPFW